MLAAVLLTVGSNKKLEESVYIFEDIKDNWRRGPLMDITRATGSLCPPGFQRIFKGNWTGTVGGCDCLQVPSCLYNDFGFNQLHKDSCTDNQTDCGCANVPSTPLKEIWNWPGNIQFCGLFRESLSFNNNFENSELTGSCKTGFKRCGGKIRSGQGVCISESHLDCPINSIVFASSNPDPEIYEQIVGDDSNLYFSRKKDVPPLVNLKLAEEGICTLNETMYSPGKSLYKLMAGNFSNKCKEDTRYTECLDEAGELDLFNLNNVPYQALPEFNPSNIYRYKKLSRTIIPFSPICHEVAKEIGKGEEIFDHFNSSISLALLFGGLSILFSFCCGTAECCFVISNKFIAKLVLAVIRLIIWIAYLIFLVIAKSEAKDSSSFFTSLSKEGCSDSLTNELLADFDKAWKKHAIDSPVKSIIFVTICIIVDLILATCFYPKKSMKALQKTKDCCSNCFSGTKKKFNSFIRPKKKKQVPLPPLPRPKRHKPLPHNMVSPHANIGEAGIMPKRVEAPLNHQGIKPYQPGPNNQFRNKLPPLNIKMKYNTSSGTENRLQSNYPVQNDSDNHAKKGGNFNYPSQPEQNFGGNNNLPNLQNNKDGRLPAKR